METTEKEHLFGKTLREIEHVVTGLGMQRFAARQLADWMYNKNISSIDEMTNISFKSRQELTARYDIGRKSPVKALKSVDGTLKYLFEAGNNKFIETAYIPDKNRATLCISSQIGCKMGCEFCMTGKQGFQGNLNAGEILNQLSSLPEFAKITNIVFMGMGEPFDNVDEVLKSLDVLTSSYGFALSPRRITVSTAGIIPGMKRFLEESKCHLAVSLQSPYDAERLAIMPIQKLYPLKNVINEIKKIHFGLQRRVSFEYIMFRDFNDTPSHALELSKILDGLNCRVNLIKFHPIPGTMFTPSKDDTIDFFNDVLNKKGIISTIRHSRGQDIMAACGLLSTLEKK